MTNIYLFIYVVGVLRHNQEYFQLYNILYNGCIVGGNARGSARWKPTRLSTDSSQTFVRTAGEKTSMSWT